MKKFCIETFGCEMNKNDSEMMGLSMIQHGFEKTSDKMKADIIIYNTCAVRENAENRAVANIIEQKAHAKRRGAIVVMAGCVAQEIGQSMVKEKKVDLAIGPYQNANIGYIIEEYFNGKKDSVFTSQDKKDFAERLHPELASQKSNYPWHKYVTITHGCENFCTYCIVPFTRGPLISFDSTKILNYIGSLPDQGISEITLLGQNVNQYGQDNGDIPFWKLLDQVAGVRGLSKISFLTSHPKDFDLEIVNVIANNENLSRAIHLPLQSGSDRILEKMNRKYDLKHYMNIFSHIDNELKDYSISTDLIVGFPGETEDDYQATLEAVKTIKYDNAFMYAFSSRNGTKAATYAEQIPDTVKTDRLKNLIELHRAQAAKKMALRVGKEEQLFVERVSKKSDNEVMGKTLLDHPLIIPGDKNDLGKRIPVTISEIKGSTLYGKRIV